MAEYQPFVKAKAVWAAGREREVNRTCVFTARLPALKAGVLRVTASCLYRAFLNGRLIAYGPARAAHDFFRVDEVPLAAEDRENFLYIEVAGYNCNSFYTLNQPSFLRAEVLDGGTPVAYTAAPCKGFTCYVSAERLQKTARFSFQRSFLENYAFSAPFTGFSAYGGEPVQTAEVGYGRLMPRKVGYPALEYQAFEELAHGKVRFADPPEKFPRYRYLTNEDLVIFREEEWEIDACDTAYNFVYSEEQAGGVRELNAGEYAVFAYDRSLTGFLETELCAEEDSLVYVLFDEVDYRKDCKEDSGINVCFWRNDTLNLITYALKKGKFYHISFEAYTAKYIKVVVVKGKVRGLKTGVRKYENPDVRKLYFRCGDEKLNAIVEAARETLAHNSVDVLTDCPSRERAGWLCDSYFSSRAEKLFTGENKVERNFLENYANQSPDLGYEDGVLSMCYPADTVDGQFIPNWIMFYILELEDYYERTGDKEFTEKVFGKAESAIRYFERFENEYGLLEDLEGWVFVEWSKANDDEFLKGVNFPSNMLYAKTLESFGTLYGREEYVRKAARLKETIREKSFNGTLFEDNLVREHGELKRCGHTSETCQYYAFYFGIADEERYPDLYSFVFGNLGPRRDSKKDYADVYVSNAFIGNLLRLDYLVQQGRVDQFLDESKEYYYKMASVTGTLWEHNEISNSLNHGFASYIANMIVKCLTGFNRVDERDRLVYFDAAQALRPCEVRIPVMGGWVTVTCGNGERKIALPEGYKVRHAELPLFRFGGSRERIGAESALAGGME